MRLDAEKICTAHLRTNLDRTKTKNIDGNSTKKERHTRKYPSEM